MNPLRLFMAVLAYLPLVVLRAMGRMTGHVFFAVSARRRGVVLTNLKACFPQLTESQRRQLAKRHFVLLGQSLWDRAWLWHAPESVVKNRMVFSGDFTVLDDPSPLIVLAPHFIGLDAGGLAMTYLRQIPMAFVFVPLRNRFVEDWVMRGRNRSARVRSVPRNDGAQPLLQALKEGLRLHYSPDMDFGIQGAEWIDFFGVSAATTYSLPRLAKLSKARVCTLVTRLTPAGYEVAVGPAWPLYPSGNVTADTVAMNQAIEAQVN
ncbi:MAG: lysophospholipid acyltransferase family protein, partial [Burkholderiales bacterium]